MRKGIKEKLLLAFATTIGLILSSCSKPTGPESDFKELFGDLSVGVPQYQTFSNFFRPADVIKGDYCIGDFIQSEPQFRLFAYHLGANPAEILSSNGILIKAVSKLDPKYPWFLDIEAHTSKSSTNLYEVHIEGRQPYD